MCWQVWPSPTQAVIARWHFDVIRSVIGELVRSIRHALIVGRDRQHLLAQFDSCEDFRKHPALLGAFSVMLTAAIDLCHGAPLRSTHRRHFKNNSLERY